MVFTLAAMAAMRFQLLVVTTTKWDSAPKAKSGSKSDNNNTGRGISASSRYSDGSSVTF